MVTAANGAEEHYTTEDNTARTESPEEARQKDEATKSAWSSHRNHRVIDNSTGFTEKIMRAISAFGRVLHMPNAREKERKHLVTDYGFAEEFVDEHNLSGVELVQAYTKIVDGEEERVRLRRDMETDEVACVRTRKTETKDFGERGETSEDITKSEFRDGVNESVYPAMVKDRYYLYAEGYRFVIDEIKEPVRRAYVEVELVSMEEDPNPPLGLDKHTRQVTGEKKHKAAAIVRRNS
jgi:CYTH domain-containing protein